MEERCLAADIGDHERRASAPMERLVECLRLAKAAAELPHSKLEVVFDWF
jgi:hypothetical protein